MRDEERFGAFLRKKREEHNITMLALAKALDVSGAYFSDVERGRRLPLNPERIRKAAEVLSFNKDEMNQMFDLAAISRGTVAQDILDYIKKHDYVVRALRLARTLGATESDWMDFVSTLKHKNATEV